MGAFWPARDATSKPPPQPSPGRPGAGEESHFRLCYAPTALLMLLFFACGITWAEPAGSIQQTIVTRGEGHFPVAVRLKDNRIAVVLRGGGPHLSIHGRLDIVFSSDEGKTWTKPAIVAADPAADVRNPAFGQASDGSLVVAYYRTTRYDENGKYNSSLDKPVNTWVTRSSDDGKNWSKPTQIDVSDIGWASPFGRIITRSDGTMFANFYGGAIKTANQAAPKSSFSYLYRSTDQGRTWKRYATISPPGFDETGLIVLPSGRWLAGLRSSGKSAHLALSHSDDDGKTWSKPEAMSPPGFYTADFILLPDQRILLTMNRRSDPFGVEAVVGDRDGNFDWKNALAISEDGANADCGYPSSVMLNDGRVMTFFYSATSRSEPKLGIHCAALTYRPE